MGTLLAEHKVHFEYGDRNIQIQQNKETIEKNQPTIKCVISNKEGEEVVSGIVGLHHQDHDNKIYGREFAFRKAVKKIANKDLRSSLRRAFRLNLKSIDGIPEFLTANA